MNDIKVRQATAQDSEMPTGGLPEGLSWEEAKARLARDGPNLLPLKPPEPAVRQLAAQLFHFFAVMLWVAGILAIVAGMPQLGLAVFVVIVLNGIFAFLQEYRAERASEKLRDLLPRRATVIRSRERVGLDASELVVGDLVLLQAGDRVSADLDVVQAFTLSVDASTLTGESVPVPIQSGDTAWAGTFVVEGEGHGFVSATGVATRLAGIAHLAQSGHRPRTPLANELDRVVRVISVASLVAGGVFLAVAALVGIRLNDAFLFSLGVVVALVPEGLLPTVTLSLAWGAQRMAEHKALVRRLEAVETLGSTTFICTDKTGTLTQNEMSVVAVWTTVETITIGERGYNPEVAIHAEPRQLPVLREIGLSAAYCSKGRAVQRNNAWIAEGSPLEVALGVFAQRLGFCPQREASSDRVRATFPFDPRRRRTSVLVDGQLHVVGAPDAVLPKCLNQYGAEGVLKAMGGQGLRVIAVARRDIPGTDLPKTADGAESNLQLLAILGIEDPPRPEVAQSISACRRAGIKVAMVTGDHPATAQAIANQVGLIGSDGLIVEGHDLPADNALLGAFVDRDGIVLSRVTPEDKLRIARALRARGHIVAMTGDGVNDGPALQEASIGIAMGRSGTDVAREAADLVLLDDNFSTIVAAIKLGRTTFANTRRFLTYHLTDNVAELAPFVLWALSGGRFPMMLGVLQVLCLDIGTDILPALSLGTEPPRAAVLDGSPTTHHLLDRSVLMRAFGLLGPLEAVVELLAFLAVMAGIGWRPGTAFPSDSAILAASGAAFAAVVIGQMANAFACRSVSQWPGALGWTSNRAVVYAVIAEVLLLTIFLFFTPLARILGHAPPTRDGAVVAMLAFPLIIAADALYKRIGKGKHGWCGK